MEVYEKIYEYINYFEETNKDFCTYSAGYSVYDETFENFIEDLRDTDLLKNDYRLYIDELDDPEELLTKIGTEKIKDILIMLV